MALFDGALKGLGGVLIGFGAGLGASSALPRIGATLRPVAKGLVKGMLVAVEGLQRIVAEASAQVNDLIAEVRAESAQGSSSGRKQGTARARGDRSEAGGA